MTRAPSAPRSARLTAATLLGGVALLTGASFAFDPTAMATAQTAPAATTAAASTADVTRRVDRIERELRAVQRRVFPGAQDGLIQPDVQPANAVASGATGASSPAQVTDLTARIDALESQLARMTDQVEQQGFRQRELDTSLTRLRTELTARINALDPATTATPSSTAPTAISATPTPAPRPAAATPAPRPATTAATPPPATPRPASTATPRPAATTASTTRPPAPSTNAARRAQVAAIEVPSTGNAAEDAYLYGYRLWEAHLYPEAQVQLQKVVDDYPTHRRASYAGNLLGRAFLDNDQPTFAIQALYNNYRTRPRGERAPESVYFMGMALIDLDRRTDACRTFDEFTRVYGATAADSLKARVETARGTAGC